MRTISVSDNCEKYSAIYLCGDEPRMVTSEVAEMLVLGDRSKKDAPPPEAHLCGEQIVIIRRPNGKREHQQVSVLKPNKPARVFSSIPAASGSAKMGPPAISRKRPNKLRGRGRLGIGKLESNAYFAFLEDLLRGDERAKAIVDSWKFTRRSMNDGQGNVTNVDFRLLSIGAQEAEPAKVVAGIPAITFWNADRKRKAEQK